LSVSTSARRYAQVIGAYCATPFVFATASSTSSTWFVPAARMPRSFARFAIVWIGAAW